MHQDERRQQGHDARSRMADYTIVASLGAAANGELFLATPPPRLRLSTDRVVIKVFDAVCDAAAHRRGVRELRAFAAVTSPYLARVFDATLSGQFMYAMEYFPLGSLGEPAAPLTRCEILSVAADATRGVHALHEAGIAHGNITPWAMMIASTGGQTVGGRICDLGLSRALTTNDPLTSFSRPHAASYVDPVLLSTAATPSRATDIWSLGASLHFALTGETVYGADFSDQPLLAVRAAMSGHVTVSAQLDDASAELIRCCLGDPGARPSTAAELADRITALGVGSTTRSAADGRHM